MGLILMVRFIYKFALCAHPLTNYVYLESFWNNLTPESAILVRVFVNRCLSMKDGARLEAASLPTVTAFAFHIQEAYNAIIEQIQEINIPDSAGTEIVADEGERDRIEVAKAEFVLRELLKVAGNLDYADEIGRREVFAVVSKCRYSACTSRVLLMVRYAIGDMLTRTDLPEGLIGRCMDVMKDILPDEREFVRVIVEVMNEVKDKEHTDEVHSPVGWISFIIL